MLRFFVIISGLLLLWMPLSSANLTFSQSGDLCGTILKVRTDDSEISCNAFRIGHDLYVSNAHCVDNGAKAAALCEDKESIFEEDLSVNRVIVNTQWNGETAANDLALFRLENEMPTKFEQKTGISKAKEECGYFMVSKVGDFEKLIPLCIEDIKVGILQMKVTNGYVIPRENCSGLSGSPIYSNDFKSLVGVLSGVNDLDNCNLNLLAVDMSEQVEFLNRATESLMQDGLGLCGDSCVENACSSGLHCASNRCSFSPKSQSCTSESGLYCSNELGIVCGEGDLCLSNRCVDVYNNYLGELEENKKSVYWFVKAMTNVWTIVILAFSAVFFVMLILLVDEKSIGKVQK